MGGHAAHGSPIPGELVMPMYNEVVKKIKGSLGLTDKDFRPLGSSGKKGKGQFSGDIDIAVDGFKLGAKNKLSFDEVFDFLSKKAKSKFENVVISKGINVISFLYPIPNSDEKGQVDFMLTDDLDYTSFVYHSPDFTKNESKYKGMYRNMIIHAILRNIDTGDVTEYYEDEFDGKFKGQVKRFSKYSINNTKGMMKQLRSFEGKIKRLSKSKPIKEKDDVITKVPSEIVKFVLGKEYDVKDAVSFESIYNIVTSSKYIYKDKAKKIISDLKDSITNMGVPLPSEMQ